jgi:hypothetical protein
MEGMSIEFSTGAKGKDLFLKNVSPSTELLENVRKSIWRLMSADR